MEGNTVFVSDIIGDNVIEGNIVFVELALELKLFINEFDMDTEPVFEILVLGDGLADFVNKPELVLLFNIDPDVVIVGVFVLLLRIDFVVDTELVLVLLVEILPDIVLVTDLVLVLLKLLDELDDTVLVFVVVNVAVDVNDADAVVLTLEDPEPESEYDSTFVFVGLLVIVG
jgi:hypothetical protein